MGGDVSTLHGSDSLVLSAAAHALHHTMLLRWPRQTSSSSFDQVTNRVANVYS